MSRRLLKQALGVLTQGPKALAEAFMNKITLLAWACFGLLLGAGACGVNDPEGAGGADNEGGGTGVTETTSGSGGTGESSGTGSTGGVIADSSGGGATGTAGGTSGGGGGSGDGGASEEGGGGLDAGPCSLVAQGTDYPGMMRTVCPATSTHVAGAVTPGGANVTVKDNGATVTLDNGIVSIDITKSSGTISSWTYDGQNLLAGGVSGGQVYWELESGNGTYTLTADPASNGGNQAEVRIHTTGSSNNLDVGMDYALLRGSAGFYATGILTHPASYAATSGGEWRSNVYNGTIFDWLSVDAVRDREMCTPADWANSVAVDGAPAEVRLLTTGIYKGQYECKYSYSADIGDEDAWGWSSTSQNIGMWVTKPSGEYYNGGPKKRELMANIANGPGPNLLNMLGGSHYQQDEVDETIPAGVDLSKVYGPFFYYNNKVPAGTSNMHDVLFADAIAQAKAEQAAWPYTWFVNSGDGDYVQQSGRATVTGTLAVSDPGAPPGSPPSSGNMWIGLAPDDGVDPQYQFFTYQFWVRTAADGSFTIPHVLPGTYALWTFGPGAAGTFTTATTAITGTNTLTKFTKGSDVTVAAAQTLSLGAVSVTATRTAATVWEIGVPDRDSHEFVNGAYDYSLWATSYVDYASKFGSGVNYTVGTDAYSTAWNYSMMDNTTWTVNFDLANAPTAGSTARFYLALASSYGANLNVSVNGKSIGAFGPGDPSDAVVRLGSHGAFWDTQFLFSADMLKAGANTLTIQDSSTTGTVEWDYLRLEADGI